MRGLSLAKALALLPLLATFIQAEDPKGTSGTCSESSKCVSGCCSKGGYCGFGDDFCGDDVCISDCDAQAECGPYAPVANSTCPLNVCCSQFGFCGTTKEFCGDGCSSGCDAVDQPSCSGTSSEKVYAGYFEAWNYQHACDNLEPKNIDVTPWTHLYYAFAGISSDDSTIKFTNDNDEEWIPQMVALKKKKPSLKVWLSVGGWDLGGEIFSDMVRFPGTRKAFVDSAVDTMSSCGFDGIDIDWEYPASSDRSGRDEDAANLVTLVQEMKTAFGDDYGISATLPSSYYYLKGFNVTGMADYVDHFNYMSYDIHGTWDGNSAWTSSDINPHTNLTEINEGLDLLWRNNIDPAQVHLGLGFYGRSFTLNDTSCTEPGCPFDKTGNTNGGGEAGQCTGSSGILSDYEVAEVLDIYDPKVTYNEQAAVNWMTWNDNQWVSFDNAKTLKQKADYANSRCLGGLFAWTLDEGGPASTTNPNKLDPSDSSMSGADVDGGSDGSGDVYIAADVAAGDTKSNTATGIAPLNLIVAPSTLASTTTITIDPFPTELEVAWTTTVTVTVEGTPTVTTTVARTVEPTTFTIEPITTGIINWWNWNITGSDVTKTSTVLLPSINLGPIVFPDDENPEHITSADFTTHTATKSRTIFPPPWPWSHTSLPGDVPTPTVTFTQGPAGPTCTANCGTKCTSFCEGPCLDCDDAKSNEGWADPEDPNPPASHSKCTGPECHNGGCTGSNCQKKGCTGSGCDNSVCIDDSCKETGCIGDDCGSGGSCDGDDCKTVGCEGSDCNGSGGCFGLDCISIGCTGIDCDSSTGECTGPNCHKVSCSGPNCQDGVCTGEGCESEDDDCEADEAEVCTESVYSSIVTPTSTYTTKTSTSCETITACSAEASTTTTTISEADLTAWTEYWNPEITLDTAVASSLAASLEAAYSSIYDYDTKTTSSSTPSSTSSKASTTTTSTTSSSVVHGTPTATSVDATPTTFHSPSNESHIEMNFYKDSSCGDFIAGYEWENDPSYSSGNCEQWGLEKLDGGNMVASSVYPVFRESDWNLGIQSIWEDCKSNNLGQQLKTRTCYELDYNPDGDDPNGRGDWIVFSNVVPYAPGN